MVITPIYINAEIRATEGYRRYKGNLEKSFAARGVD
jgi:hypothetical protein